MRIKNRFDTCLLVCICLSISSCKKEDPEQNFIREKQIVSPFYTITIESTCELHLIQDTAYSVELYGPERIVKKFDISIENYELKLSGRNPTQFLHPREGNLQVYIHVDSLVLVNVYESCSIVTDNALTGDEIGIVSKARMLEADIDVNCRVFYYWNNPTGVKMKIRGQTQELKIWNAGLSTIDAREVQSPYVLAANGSQGNITVNPGQFLEYSLTSIGNIYYYGNPQLIRKTITGNGKLIQVH